MNLKKIVHILMMCVCILQNNLTFSQSIFDLKGQNIIIPPTMPYYMKGYKKPVESIYVSDVLNKMKFDEKYLYSESIEGQIVSVIDVRHINPDNKKKEAVLLILDHNGKEVVYYIPLRYKSQDMKSFRGFIVRDQYERGRNYRRCNLEDIDIVCYNADSIDAATKYLQNRDLWPVFRKGTENESITQTDAPYSFAKFRFKDSNKFNSREIRFQTLYGTFKNSEGNFRRYEFLHRNRLPEFHYTGADENILSDIPSMFITANELKKRCENMIAANAVSMQLNDSILKTFKGKEIYIYDQNIPDKTNQLSYCITDKQMKHGEWNDGYFTLTDIQVLPILNNMPHHGNYAILEDSLQNKYALLVSNSIFNFVKDGESHRNEIQQQIIEQDKMREAEILAQEKQEQEYKISLIKKYGSKNAKMILKGEIAIGFNKDMVEEALGYPDDITTITNYLGKVTMWTYYNWRVVYFINGKVVQIIE